QLDRFPRQREPLAGPSRGVFYLMTSGNRSSPRLLACNMRIRKVVAHGLEAFDRLTDLFTSLNPLTGSAKGTICATHSYSNIRSPRFRKLYACKHLYIVPEKCDWRDQREVAHVNRGYRLEFSTASKHSYSVKVVRSNSFLSPGKCQRYTRRKLI